MTDQPIIINPPDTTAYLAKRQDKWLPIPQEEPQWRWQELFRFPATWWQLSGAVGFRLAFPSVFSILLYWMPWVQWKLFGLVLIVTLQLLFVLALWFLKGGLSSAERFTWWGILGLGNALAINSLRLLEQ